MNLKLKAGTLKFIMNIAPVYRGTGGRVLFISRDFMEVKIKVPLNFRTRNYVGTIYGGSMYGSVDPIYMLMLINILGPDYIVWDRSAKISFLKPGRSTLHADFKLTQDEIGLIKKELIDTKSIDRIYTVELKDRDGVSCARIEKTIYIRRADKK